MNNLPHPTPDNRITDVVLDDGRRMPDLVLRVFAQHMEQQHRMNLLAAGVLGLVIPVLSTAGIVVSPWSLRRAIYLCAASLVLGVIANGLARATMPSYLASMEEGIRRRAHDIGFAQGLGGPERVAAALGSRIITGHGFRYLSAIHWLLESLQYVTFILAAVYIARSF